MKVNITIPVFNEEGTLAASIVKLREMLFGRLTFAFEIVIANNGSTDRTLEIARQIACGNNVVHVTHSDAKGRGRALKLAWAESDAQVLSYMDVDLSTDLDHFPTLISALVGGGYDLAVGSRLLNPKTTTRKWKREVISRCYNRLVKAVFGTRFSDAQCGFKAITKNTAMKLLPLVEDNGWFLDTELLILAEKLGYRIYDFPVRWVEDPDSRVKIFRTAFDDIKGVMRVKRNLQTGRYRNWER